jgi:hypothetical protein
MSVLVLGTLLFLAAFAWLVLRVRALRQLIATQRPAGSPVPKARRRSEEKPLSRLLVRGTLLALIVAMGDCRMDPSAAHCPRPA